MISRTVVIRNDRARASSSKCRPTSEKTHALTLILYIPFQIVCFIYIENFRFFFPGSSSFVVVVVCCVTRGLPFSWMIFLCLANGDRTMLTTTIDIERVAGWSWHRGGRMYDIHTQRRQRNRFYAVAPEYPHSTQTNNHTEQYTHKTHTHMHGICVYLFLFPFLNIGYLAVSVAPGQVAMR